MGEGFGAYTEDLLIYKLRATSETWGMLDDALYSPGLFVN
jgi:hypothetical protein